MLLEELLFCVVFIVLPLVGMVGIGIKRALNGLNREGEELKESAIKEEGRLRLKMLFKGVRGEKQLKGEVTYLQPLIVQHKIRTHQRAGP